MSTRAWSQVAKDLISVLEANGDRQEAGVLRTTYGLPPPAHAAQCGCPSCRAKRAAKAKAKAPTGLRRLGLATHRTRIARRYVRRRAGPARVD